MKANLLIEAIDHLDDALIETYFQTEEALEMKKTKRKTSLWLKWGVLAACLCLVVMGAIFFRYQDINAGGRDVVQIVDLIDSQYVICGKGEAEILKALGLPTKPAFYHAGARVTYLKFDGEDSYGAMNGKSDVMLYEYRPNPSDLVYVVKIDGEYHFAIRWDKVFPSENREDLGL